MQVIKEKVDPDLVDLISKVMRYNPAERYTPYQALMHPYFDELRDQKMYRDLCEELEVPVIFDFTEEECTFEEYQTLMPAWCRAK